MSRRTLAVAAVGALMCSAASGARAQQTTNEAWPELDVFWTDHSGSYRLFGMASINRTSDAASRQGTLGVHADYVSASGFLLWPLGFYVRLGYRQIESIPAGTYHEQRALIEMTAAAPVDGGMLRLENRARIEQRWISGVPSERFRDRIRVDHRYAVGNGWAFAPYGAYEVYWETQHHPLVRSAYRLGTVVGRTGPAKVDASYARQDNRFGSPRHVNAVAVTVSLHYGGPKGAKR